MQYLKKLAVLCLLMLVGSLMLVAQEDTETASDENFPLNFEIPEDFELSFPEAEPSYALLTGEEVSIRLYPASVLNPILEENAELSGEEVLATFLAFAEIDDTVDNAAILPLEDELGLGYGYVGETYQAYLLLQEDASILSVLILEGDMDAESLTSLMQSIEVIPVSNEPCLVSTESERTVRIHVGPGTNRTSIAFLATGESFEVLGEAEAADGSRWFKLDKQAVAPNSSALETWVAADDVLQEGNCDAIGEAFAPPIIPIIQQPATTNNTSGDNEGGEATNEDGATASPVNSGTGYVDPNNLGAAESTIRLQNGVYNPVSNPNSFIVVRMGDAIIEIEACYKFSTNNTGQCLFSTWQLVGTNIFQNGTSYLTVQSQTTYTVHSNTTFPISFYYRVRDNLPEDLTRYSVLENR